MKHFILPTFLLAVLFLPTLVQAEGQMCTNDADCALHELCSINLANCSTDPACSGNCPSICTGTCTPESTSPLTLETGLNLQDAFISTTCTINCPVTLWIKLIEGVSTQLLAGATVGIDLFLVQEDNQLVPTLSIAKPLLSSRNTIDAFSVQLPNKSISQLYPYTEKFVLKISYNATVFSWYIKVIQLDPNSPYIITYTKRDPTSSEVNTFLKDDSIHVLPPNSGVYFPDLVPTNLIYTAAYNLSAQKIISGYPDGTFKPLNQVNRAEAAKFLLNARYKTLPIKPARQIFPDVPLGEWFTPYIMLAADLEVIKGYEDGTFKPANTVNTAEFLKMLALTFNLPLNVSYSYIDVPDDVWFAQYAGIASTYNLFPKRPSYVLYPDMLLTREEVAIAIDALLQQL